MRLPHRFALIAALVISAHSTAASAAGSPDPGDMAVCRFVAATEPHVTDRYLVRAAVFDLDGEGTPERLSVADEGTMHIDHYAVAKADGSEVAIAEPAVDDDDWAWNMTQRWLIYAGRAYVLRFAGYGTDYPRFVSRIGPGPVEQPLCKLAPQTEVALEAKTTADADLCKAVASGAVRYETATRFPEPRAAPGRDIVGGKATATGKIALDFANDGRSAEAYLYEVESGAGGGCDLKYFDTAPADLKSPHHQLLAALQGLDFNDAYTRRTCADAEPGWFTFQRKHYLETRAEDASTPASERDEYRFVDVVDRGKPRRVCEAEYTHQPPKLVGVWDGAKWGPPTP